MRRFSPIRQLAGFLALAFFAVPMGITVVGCSKATTVQYCSGNNESGVVLGQATHITLASNLIATGESLNYGQIGQTLSASATDCQGNAVSVRSFTYTTTDDSKTYADINPASGQVCAGTWNRQTGGGIPDYTICTAPASQPKQQIAYVTASSAGVSSNAIAVYVHPVVTGIVLGGATPAGGCPTTANPNGTDPGSDCCPFITTGTQIPAPAYSGTSCLSQGVIGQLIGRVYANGQTNAANNITCSVGHLNFAAQTSGNVVTIDQNGVATANQPGSTIITATVSNSATAASAGFFSTCPPASIQLVLPNSTATSVSVPLNNLQPLTATVLDTNGKAITGLNLEFNSTTPQTIPGTVGSATPVFPGTATITAVCQPGTCNPSPFSQLGLFGNGEPITSNGITVTATGTSSTVLYMGSTQSQYVQPRDFTTGQVSAPIKLPYAPNSMVITQDGGTIYLGSAQGLMTISTGTNTPSAANQLIQGTVLAVSPDGSTLVITDPTRATVSLVSSGGNTASSYGGVGVRAEFTPDSQTVYVTTTASTLLLHSQFTGWQSIPTSEPYSDVSVTVPNVGAYFAGANTIDGRSYCTTSTVGTGTPPAVTNQFAPQADQVAAPNQRIAATTDGAHMIAANAVTGGAATLTDLHVSFPATGTQPGGPGSCTTITAPVKFTSNATTTALAGIVASSIVNVLPASNSTVAFVTYQGTSGILPLYTPNGTAAGAYTPLMLQNGASALSAPVSGVFSTDNLLFFAGTSGDNQVHQFSITGKTVTETGVLSPALPAINGTGTAPVDLIAQRPKRTQS